MRAWGALGVLHKDKQGRVDGSTRRLKISPRYLNYVLEWVSRNPQQWCQLNARSVSDMEIMTASCDLVGWTEVSPRDRYQHFLKLWRASPFSNENCSVFVLRHYASYVIILHLLYGAAGIAFEVSTARKPPHQDGVRKTSRRVSYYNSYWRKSIVAHATGSKT